MGDCVGLPSASHSASSPAPGPQTQAASSKKLYKYRNDGRLPLRVVVAGDAGEGCVCP